MKLNNLVTLTKPASWFKTSCKNFHFDPCNGVSMTITVTFYAKSAEIGIVRTETTQDMVNLAIVNEAI